MVENIKKFTIKGQKMWPISTIEPKKAAYGPRGPLFTSAHFGPLESLRSALNGHFGQHGHVVYHNS